MTQGAEHGPEDKSRSLRMTLPSLTADRETMKKELIVFLILTFAATYLLELFGIWLYGPGILTSRLMLIPMYIPAVCAILCMVWFSSPALTQDAKIFLASFLAAAAVSLVEGLYQPLLGTIGPLPLCTAIVCAGSFLLLVIQNIRKTSREDLAPARLSFGRNFRYYLFLPVAFAAFFIAGLLISYYAGLSLPAKAFEPSTFLIFIGLYLVTFFVAWPSFFGEEYGWRYYLQDRIFALAGTGRGVVLVGLIWGLWHLPLNLMGMNFADNPVMGNLVYLLYAIVVGITFSYAVLKTGSIWIAVLLHAITDSMVVNGYQFLANGQILAAFLPVLVLLAVFAAILLRSKVWTEERPAPERL